MSLGVEQAGFDVVAAVEMDPVHCAVHKFNFPHCEVICSSVRNVAGAVLSQIADRSGGAVDLVFGGPPCQGFSMMGKRALEDPRNSLVLDFVRLVVETSANWFVLENVRGLTVGKHSRFLYEIVEEFERNGYQVRLPWRVLNAAEFGVPQDRNRLFLIGAKNGLPLPGYPEPTHCRAAVGDGLFRFAATPTVAEALADLPDADAFDELLESDSVRTLLGEPSDYAARLRGMIRDADDYSYRRRYDAALVTSSMRTVHTEESRRRFLDASPGAVERISRFFKLDPEGISNTLRAGTASDRGAFTSPRPIHPFSPRCVTVREMARLHSFPDWFRFHVTKWHGARQIGNSVPPLLARAVAARIMECTGAESKRPAQTFELGDARLLSMTMSQAADHFGVRPDVIPQRLRENGAKAGK